MLRKLMKHEFRATGRTMLPLYLIVLVTALGANFSIRGMMDTESALLNVLGGLLVTAFGVSIAAVCIMAMVVMVRRFYKNLLQDEGYVMMTLPVSVHQQVWSKLLVSAVWFAATALVVVLAAFVMTFNVGALREVWNVLRAMFREITASYAINGTIFIVELLAVGFAASCVMCLEFYAALAAGHSRPNHKLVWSVGCFFAFQFVMQMASSLVMAGLGNTGAFRQAARWLDGMMSAGDVSRAMTATHVMLLSALVLCVIYGAVYYFVTTYCLKKHLNLE